MVWFYGCIVFYATYNISVISWRSDLLVEETGVPGENHRPVASHWLTLSHNVVHLALSGMRVVICPDCKDKCFYRNNGCYCGATEFTTGYLWGLCCHCIVCNSVEYNWYLDPFRIKHSLERISTLLRAKYRRNNWLLLDINK